jgi:hypothetical protein
MRIEMKFKTRIQNTNSNYELRKRDSRRRNDSRAAQDFRVLFVAQRANCHARIFEKFYFSQRAIFPQFRKHDLPRQALHRAKIDHHFFRFRMMRIRIRFAAHFRERVKRVIRLAVIKQRPVALVNLLELAQRIGPVAGMAPHLFPFNEERIPVIDARVDG